MMVSDIEVIIGLWGAFLTLVPFHVQRQVIRAGKTSAAHTALERLGPSVFPEMASQLIRTSETPLTALPGALVWLFSYNRA